MNEPEMSPAPADAEALDQHVCQFPVGYDPESGEFEVAGHPIPPSTGRRGRKADYCGDEHVDPDGVRRRHDRAGAFQRRRELKLQAAGQAPRPSAPAPRPVTSARASLAELLAQWEMVTTTHHRQQAELIDRVAEIVATAGDPDAAVAEVARIRAEAKDEIDAANARAAEAEQDAITARRERDRAIEDRALAEGAAEDAIADRDAQIAAAREEAEQARRDATQAEHDAAEALADRDAAIADANERIAQAEHDAAEEIATIRAQAEDRIARIEADAEQKIARYDETARQATAARNEAEADRAGAEQAAADARTEADRLRRDLAAAQEAHRAELVQLREDIAAVGAAAPAPPAEQPPAPAAPGEPVPAAAAAPGNAHERAQ
ncbi:hypothetical protein, partial [Nocardia cyriacigeorgica]|uniref:hypothetical protein n=1 Tax=Nocardia cyriacigeorgica TaxID=135487 RepID=UPI0024545734